jgi:hypothetical protein
MLSVQQASAAALTFLSEEKWPPFNCFFSVQGTGGSPTGPDPENRVGDHDKGRPVSSGLHVPGVPEPWKISKLEDAVFIQKIEARQQLFQRIFTLGFLLEGGVSRYVTTPFIVASSPGHSNITKFRPWLSIATGNHLDRAGRKNSRSCSNDCHRDILIRV